MYLQERKRVRKIGKAKRKLAGKRLEIRDFPDDSLENNWNSMESEKQ
jgi:predicted transcriptional regulator